MEAEEDGGKDQEVTEQNDATSRAPLGSTAGHNESVNLELSWRGQTCDSSRAS